MDFSGSKISLKAGTPHTLSFSYDGTGTAEFIIDGKRNARIRREGGAMAKSAYGIAIGSRWRSNYFSFDGDIFSVKLYELERPDLRWNSSAGVSCRTKKTHSWRFSFTITGFLRRAMRQRSKFREISRKHLPFREKGESV